MHETLYHSQKNNAYLLHHRVSADGTTTYEQLRIYSGDCAIPHTIIVHKDKKNCSINKLVINREDVPESLDHFFD